MTQRLRRTMIWLALGTAPWCGALLGCGTGSSATGTTTCGTCGLISGGTLVSFVSTPIQAVPSRANYSGINSQLFDNGTSYRDPNMQALAQTLDLGWVRFPAGTADDPYNWQTGDTPNSWISEFSTYSSYSMMQNDADIIRGKGGILLSDYAAMLSTFRTGPTGTPNSSPTQTIGVINVFTDTPASAAALVLAAQSQGGNVDVWELGNEPVYFSGFFPNATAYLNAVKPFATAIKLAVPTAKVAVWVDPQSSAWTQAVAAYPQPFWDELYTHSYPDASGYSSTTAGQIQFYNGFLLNNTNTLVESTYVQLFGSSMQIEWSEFNMNTMSGNLYNAVFIAEFLLRLASDSHVNQVGMHVLVGTDTQAGPAIGSTNDHASDCKTAYSKGMVIDTTALSFGYYLRPVGYALQVVNGPMNTSTGVLPTTISNSPTVSEVVGSTQGTMPAIYAQAFSAANGGRHLLMTNKSGSPVTLQIEQDGALVTQALTTRSIGGSDPTATNSATASSVTLVQSSAQGTVTVPSYGVMDVAWSN